MKAIEYPYYGAPDVLHLKKMTIPNPGANEVLIRVQASPATCRCIRFFRTGIPYIQLIHGLAKTLCFQM